MEKNRFDEKSIEDFLPADPIARFKYFSSTGQNERAKVIASDAFKSALRRETRRDVIKSLADVIDIDEREKTESLSYLAENGPFLYALELAEEYGADILEVEKSAYTKIMRSFSSSKGSNASLKESLQSRDWVIDEDVRRNFAINQYDISMETASKNYSHGSLELAHNALECANVLKDDEKMTEANKMVFKQSLFQRDYSLAKEISEDLSPDDVKVCAFEIVLANCRSSYRTDALTIAKEYVPEVADKIEEVNTHMR